MLPLSRYLAGLTFREEMVMKRRMSFVPLLVALVGLAVFAGAVPAFADLPPLIDRELFFGDPQIAGAQISPDGQYISFLKPFKGVRNIWVKTRTQEFSQARPITADTARPVSSYF